METFSGGTIGPTAERMIISGEMNMDLVGNIEEYLTVRKGRNKYEDGHHHH